MRFINTKSILYCCTEKAWILSKKLERLIYPAEMWIYMKAGHKPRNMKIMNVQVLEQLQLQCELFKE